MSTYLITGANRGIGLALAREVLQNGHTVLATARDPAGAVDLQAMATRNPGRITVLKLDVADPASITRLGETLKSHLGDGAIDVLVNNAGIIGPARQSTLDMDFDGFLSTLQVNTIAPLRVAQMALPFLRRSAQARILTISSAMGSMSHQRSDRIAYRTSKAAVNKVMQALASDLAPSGIAVAVAHPGWVRTDMGGQGADISAPDSARGLSLVIDGLSMNRTGSFFNYDGSIVQW